MSPPSIENDGLAETVEAAWCAFETELTDKGAYPLDLFDGFFAAVKSYAEATTNNKMIHRKVASRVNGLREFLAMERKAVPGRVLQAADRLETILFAEYDPHFDGDEPPGL
jgi:hypothetical protein